MDILLVNLAPGFMMDQQFFSLERDERNFKEILVKGKVL